MDTNLMLLFNTTPQKEKFFVKVSGKKEEGEDAKAKKNDKSYSTYFSLTTV